MWRAQQRYFHILLPFLAVRSTPQPCTWHNVLCFLWIKVVDLLGAAAEADLDPVPAELPDNDLFIEAE
jgi:hypothetical protein